MAGCSSPPPPPLSKLLYVINTLAWQGYINQALQIADAGAHKNSTKILKPLKITDSDSKYCTLHYFLPNTPTIKYSMFIIFYLVC